MAIVFRAVGQGAKLEPSGAIKAIVDFQKVVDSQAAEVVERKTITVKNKAELRLVCEAECVRLRDQQKELDLSLDIAGKIIAAATV